MCHIVLYFLHVMTVVYICKLLRYMLSKFCCDYSLNGYANDGYTYVSLLFLILKKLTKLTLCHVRPSSYHTKNPIAVAVGIQIYYYPLIVIVLQLKSLQTGTITLFRKKATSLPLRS